MYRHYCYYRFFKWWCQRDSTSTELVVGAVAVEVVTLTVLATVVLLWVVPLLTFALAAHTLAIVAAEIGAVVLAAGLLQVLAGHLVFPALTLSANTILIAPTNRKTISTSVAADHCSFIIIIRHFCFIPDY